MTTLKPKDTKFTIEKQFPVAIDLIKANVESFGSEWFLDTSRQENFVTHSQTNMYQIKYLDYAWMPGDPINITEINKMPSQEAEKQLQDIFAKIEKEYNGKVVRAEIIKMLKNTKIRKHVDKGEMLSVSRRCHIPIITNPNVFFTVFNNTVNMEEGYCYEINNCLPHAVENNSNLDRVHIIIDILPNSYFGL
jgi:hypothetical protein